VFGGPEAAVEKMVALARRFRKNVPEFGGKKGKKGSNEKETTFRRERLRKGRNWAKMISLWGSGCKFGGVGACRGPDRTGM